mgnify:CR=1 FL=1
MREPSIDDEILVSSSPPSGSGFSSAAYRDVGDGMIAEGEENVVKALACANKPKKRGKDIFILSLCMSHEELGNTMEVILVLWDSDMWQGWLWMRICGDSR